MSIQSKTYQSYQRKGCPLERSAFRGQRGTIFRICRYELHHNPTAPQASLRHLPISADCEGLGFVFTPLVFLKQLNAVVAVELNGSPVAVVADQQRTLLQAALAVRFGGYSEFGDVLGQVLLNRCPLRLRPGTLQDTSLSYRGRQENGGRLRLSSLSHSERAKENLNKHPKSIGL